MKNSERGATTSAESCREWATATSRTARRLRLDLAGYVKNLPDGRVEVYAIGPPGVLRILREELERGPRGASVSDVSEMDAPVDTQFAEGFSIEHDG